MIGNIKRYYYTNKHQDIKLIVIEQLPLGGERFITKDIQKISSLPKNLKDKIYSYQNYKYDVGENHGHIYHYTIFNSNGQEELNNLIIAQLKDELKEYVLTKTE